MSIANHGRMASEKKVQTPILDRILLAVARPLDFTSPKTRWHDFISRPSSKCPPHTESHANAHGRTAPHEQNVHAPVMKAAGRDGGIGVSPRRHRTDRLRSSSR